MVEIFFERSVVPSPKTESRSIRELCEAVNQLQSPEELKRFLMDLCTPMELASMADRWRVARLVSKQIPYRKIYEKTGVSTATITRVARSVARGEGGYQLLLRRIAESSKSSAPEEEVE
jgi:TrpR-related protein YerC/YecD